MTDKADTRSCLCLSIRHQMTSLINYLLISENKPSVHWDYYNCNLNNRGLRNRNVDRTIFPMFYFFNYNEVRNYWAIFQRNIAPNENLNNFKRNLKIQEPSTEELGKLKKYKTLKQYLELKAVVTFLFCIWGEELCINSRKCFSKELRQLSGHGVCLS